MTKYDAIVIGLGAMGAASVYQIAKSGLNVLGIDQDNPPHKRGSSHGETRITRTAIAEGKEYVPLVQRANEIWREIEAESGRTLFTKTGILIMASNAISKKNKFLESTIAAAEEYNIPHTQLNADEIRNDFPQFNTSGNEKGYYEPDAGFLNPEACIEVQLELAKRYGAELHDHEIFTHYSREADGITVTTNKGVYETSKLVLALGPWMPHFLPKEYQDTLQIYRQVLYWFEIENNNANYAIGKFPVFNWEFNTAHEDFIYGFPSLDGQSIKIATEQYAKQTDPRWVKRNVSKEEIAAMYDQYVKPHLPDVSSNCIKAEVCLYTLAPNWRFLIDRLPDDKDIIIASPCSGHGFKHSAAIGEVISQMVRDRIPEIDISRFSFKAIDA